MCHSLQFISKIDCSTTNSLWIMPFMHHFTLTHFTHPVYASSLRLPVVVGHAKVRIIRDIVYCSHNHIIRSTYNARMFLKKVPALYQVSSSHKDTNYTCHRIILSFTFFHGGSFRPFRLCLSSVGPKWFFLFQHKSSPIQPYYIHITSWICNGVNAQLRHFPFAYKIAIFVSIRCSQAVFPPIPCTHTDKKWPTTIYVFFCILCVCMPYMLAVAINLK